MLVRQGLLSQWERADIGIRPYEKRSTVASAERCGKRGGGREDCGVK